MPAVSQKTLIREVVFTCMFFNRTYKLFCHSYIVLYFVLLHRQGAEWYRPRRVLSRKMLPLNEVQQADIPPPQSVTERGAGVRWRNGSSGWWLCPSTASSATSTRWRQFHYTRTRTDAMGSRMYVSL